jgi:ribose 5-phosphate isomerase B
MRIAVGSDHAGFNLKQAILEHLTQQGIGLKDFGCYSTDAVDYPDIAAAVAVAVRDGTCDLGILICSNGVGISIAANKIEGIRAALCHDTFSARRAREHNDANILCMGEWVIGQGVAREVVNAFLSASFDAAERHVRRVDKISALDRTRGAALVHDEREVLNPN